jgi:hypothetical protein
MSAQMSGWDVSSTPTWGPQDGPEDTQSFTGHGDGSRDFGPQDFGRGGTGPSSPPAGFPEAGGFPGEGQAGGPPPEFFGQDYGQDQEIGPGGFPQRTPGRSFQDLPRREARGRHSTAPGGAYGQDNGYGQDGAYGQDGGPGQDSGYGQSGGFGQDNGHGPAGGHGQDNGYGQTGGFGQDNGHGPAGGHGQDNGYGQSGGFGQDNGYGPPDGGFGQETAFGQDWGANPDQADPWGPGGGQPGPSQPGGQPDGGWGRAPGRSAAPWEEPPQQDAGYPGPDGPQDFGQQDFGRQDYPRQTARPGFAAQDYDGGQDFPGQQGLGPQEPTGFDRGERDVAARMDPALQDFFAPQRGGGGGGHPGAGPGRPGEPRDPRRRPPTDGWENPGRSPGPRTGTGPRPAPRGPRRNEPEPRRGLGLRGLIAIGAVVAIIIVVAVVLLTHKSGSSPTASSTPPAGAATAPAAKPSASKAPAGAGTGAGTGTKTSGGGAGAATAAYTLSTPSTAGTYPIGQDPKFLATATSTAKSIESAVTAAGATVKGNPVSAAYQLPADQVITFVGYQGTFTPTKIKAILATLGTDTNAYAAGPNGGNLDCANTKATPSGAVCVWATSSTLGITEFFTATGPETLNAAQTKGASDTLKLRPDVEKKS